MKLSDRISRSQWISAYSLPSNHQVVLLYVLLYNWLQVKKSFGVSASVKVANLVPDNLETNDTLSLYSVDPDDEVRPVTLRRTPHGAETSEHNKPRKWRFHHFLRIISLYWSNRTKHLKLPRKLRLHKRFQAHIHIFKLLLFIVAISP